MLVTHYVARHDGLEIARGEDLGEVLAFAREHLRRLVTAPPAGARLRTVVGEHVIYVRAVGPDGGRLNHPGHRLGLLQEARSAGRDGPAPLVGE